MKKILLIGKSGQLGSEIIKDSLSFGFEVIGIDKDEVNIIDNQKAKELISKVNPDILINTSAYHNVPKCEELPLNAFALNFIAVRNLAKICKDKNIRLVTISTDYVFDGEKGSPYEEDDMPNPLQVYGLSKLAGEYAALNIYPENTFVIRTCGLYGGKKGSPEKGNFVLNIIKEAQGKEMIEVSSEQIVSPTYARDLSKAILKLLDIKVESEMYHLVNEGYCSWYEFTKEIFKIFNIKIKVIPKNREGLDRNIKRPKFSALKNTKAKELGIKLPHWKESVAAYKKFLDSNL